MFQGQKITVAITGGIAAYKAADIVSWLRQNGAEVHVAMTKSATEIIAPLTLKTLSGATVATDIMDASDAWNVPHIDLAACDLLLLVPATANILAKAAHGLADEIVSAILLATTAPIICMPAMHKDMYANPATAANLEILRSRGWQIVEPGSGRLACGAMGRGRLADLATIQEEITGFFSSKKLLQDKKVIISAGPTHEYLDPVRFIGNRSSGKMGYALAEAAAAAGARVVLVSGPTSLPSPCGVEIKRVISALEMQQSIESEYADADIVIMAAAVADYRPSAVAEHKIKKDNESLDISLLRNPDILATLGKDKGQRLLVGFAAETQDVEEYARRKLEQKNLDLIIANDITAEQAGFDVDTNIITAITRESSIAYPLMSKKAAARKIIELVAKLK